jgi:hypothetical protein
MKFAAFAATLLAIPSLVLAEETAYTALRAVGKQSGADSLNRVIEVRGRGGAPSPEIWKVTMADPNSRGGLREIEVQHNKIIGERTSLSRLIGTPMNFNQLNLDSDGVFTMANDEARKAGVPFDHIDYSLKGGSRGGAPVWALDLFDGKNGRVATFEIAADSGTFLRRDFQGKRVAAQGPPPPPPPPDDRPIAGEEEQGEPIHSVGDFFARARAHIEHHFEKRRRQFENFFSGKSPSRDEDQ